MREPDGCRGLIEVDVCVLRAALRHASMTGSYNGAVVFSLIYQQSLLLLLHYVVATLPNHIAH